MKGVAKSICSVRRLRTGRGSPTRFEAVAAGIWRAEAESRESAKVALREKLKRAGQFRTDCAVVFCGDGSVVVIRHDGDGWEYRTHRDGQALASACLGSWTSLDAVLVDVTRHAEQAYGGVLHISR